ncbi:MAG: hypothetical protein JSR95_14730 [Proteobacteria bacterium]|nr:hypothetical protein [Pseudomonadota bacterium]
MGPGVTLSRWTLSYFATALACLILAELLMTLGFGHPGNAPASAQTLILVHITALGWLSLLMCGALFQFVPVLVAKPLYSNSLPLPTLGCLVAGLLLLIAGFLKMGGLLTLDMPFFPLAAGMLSAGFALVLWNLARTLWAARPLPLPARFVAVGLCSVAATVGFGSIFALVLGGVATRPHFLRFLASGVPIHAIAGLGGWLTFTAMGVSYRLLAMFMLAPELDGPRTRAVFHLGTAALTVLIAGGVAAICMSASLTGVLGLSGLLGLAALVLYGGDILRLYRERKRRVIELNSRMAALAAATLAACAILILVLSVLGSVSRHAAPVIFLVAFGWLSGLGLAKLYKITAFLTWLECYGPILGKAATPRVQDLVVEQHALKWFVLYFLAVWAGTLALFLDSAPAFRICAGLMLIASLGIMVQLVRIRRLLEVRHASRLPPGVQLPPLLHCSIQRE